MFRADFRNGFVLQDAMGLCEPGIGLYVRIQGSRGALGVRVRSLGVSSGLLWRGFVFGTNPSPRNSTPQTLNPTPYTLNLSSKPETLNPTHGFWLRFLECVFSPKINPKSQ